MTFEVIKDGITFYQQYRTGVSFNISGFSLPGREDIIYSLDDYFSLEGKQIICLPDMLKKKIMLRSKQQLHAYLEAYKYRYEIYGNNRSIIYNNLHKLNTSVNENTSLIYFHYEELLSGMVTINISPYSFKYNILSGKFETEYPFFYMLYKYELPYLIAAAQIESGIAPPALMELMRIKEFLFDKPKAIVVTDDESEHTLKSPLDSILRNTMVDSEGLLLYPDGYSTLRYDSINHIKCGKSAKYYPDKEKLKCLDKPENLKLLDFWQKAA